MLEDVEGLKVAAAMRACRPRAMQADLARLALIFRFGGYWSALKNRPMRRLLDSLPAEADLLLTGHGPKPNDDLPYCNNFFGARAGGRAA